MSSGDDMSVSDECSPAELAEVAAGVGVGADQSRQPRPLVRIGRPAPDNSVLESLGVSAAS